MSGYGQRDDVTPLYEDPRALQEAADSDLEKQLFGRQLDELERRLGYSSRLSRAFSIIETDFTNPKLSLDQASGFCGVEKNHLNFLLRRSSGATFHQLLLRYRVLKGAQLLSQDRSVIEISFSCGFGSVRSLQRNFHRLLGVGACQYRQTHRGRFLGP